MPIHAELMGNNSLAWQKQPTKFCTVRNYPNLPDVECHWQWLLRRSSFNTWTGISLRTQQVEQLSQYIPYPQLL